MEKIVQKNARKNNKKITDFECINCDFKCSNKYNYDKHLLTIKHKMHLFAQNCNKCTNCAKKCQHLGMWVCDCGCSYKHQCSFSRHKKTCKKMQENAKILNDEIIAGNDAIDTSMLVIETNLESDNPPVGISVSNELVMQLLKQNNELQQMLIEQSNKMFELAKEAKYVTNNTNNQFNLNVFLNDKCKDAINMDDFVDSLQLKLKDLEETARLGYSDGISRIFINGLNELDIYKRPIHCSDLKRETIYIKDQNIWEKDDSQKTKLTKAIRSIGRKNMKQIFEWQKLYPEYNDSSSRQNDRYHKMICNVMNGSTKEEQETNLNKIIRNITKEVVINKN
jgi:hypothetical protein